MGMTDLGRLPASSPARRKGLNRIACTATTASVDRKAAQARHDERSEATRSVTPRPAPNRLATPP